MRTIMLAVGLLAVPAAAQEDAIAARVERVLRMTPLIDGHNDLPWALRERADPKTGEPDVARGTDGLPKPLHTDVARLRRGRVGAQFWSVWIPVDRQGPLAVQTTVEQIDLVHRLAKRYPEDFEVARTAADIRRIHRGGRIASLIGIEGGHQIGDSLAALRQFHALGARYMTLTHSTSTEWADSATADPKHGGLTAFGRAVVREMNRIGMIVDISHVSPDAMNDTLDEARAPVIFSHSSARGLVDHARNVPDDVLKRLPANGGVVMVTFVPGYVSAEVMRWEAARAAEATRMNAPPYAGLYIGQPERAKAALDVWEVENPRPRATLRQVADHIEHVARVAGRDHVGIGSDFDGIGTTPEGLDGVEDFPALFAELARRGWSDRDLAKLAGGNLLRVMTAVEAEAARRAPEPPSPATRPVLDSPR
jgi:membrane dipeptidase